MQTSTWRFGAMAVALCSAITTLPLSAHAQAYPTKTIRIVVPFAPGGNTDVAARLLANGLGQQMGQSIIVENRAGAGGGIGTDFVAKAAPDGYTVLLGHIGALTINPAIYDKLPYNTVQDFEPVGLAVTTPLVLVTSPNTGVKSVAELIAKAKAEPGRLTYATAGSGSAGHMASELFNLAAQIQTTHVPYKGAAPGTTALLSGEVSFRFSGQAPVQEFVKSGKLLALGVTGATPSPQFPGVPTLASLGLRNYEVQDWNGLLVPAGTPKAIVDKLNAELNKFLSLPDTQTQLARLGFEGRPGTPAEFASFIRSETEKWSKSAKAANIKAD
ncbi:tripartite tricarboxylate transporter substrate binding protein [Hydrogenophaga sp.]|uniref:Bug family tripartite tricarboxylate transporter substrate binding protein n=1 Tax=Hydrogenophaga sp. TaxID=1904254 RepID=UPI00271CBEB8|nr:tripartite tricarboxylate transporter substrate binding protein [Hydrogenophaga sp.]MDO9437182.1 tripartite tricarboxylate transporter substrate binding protein [Hydrogenophaga sp.]